MSTGLPSPLDELVRRAAGGRDLTRRERADVTRELESHFEAGLEAGVHCERLAAEFGDAALAARLIARAKPRNRPLAQRLLTVAAQAAAILAVVSYLLSAARLHASRPFLPPEPSQAAFADLLSSLHAPTRHDPGRTLGTVIAAYDDLFDRVYARHGGRLTASGLRMIQAMRGKSDPGVLAIALEPIYFALPADRREAERELGELLAPAITALGELGPRAAAETLRGELRSRMASTAWQLRYYPVAVFAPEVVSWLEAG
jgi:hypothetical protein